MASFCFISFATPGHCDFGGLSYVRMGSRLQEDGHTVQWVLSRHPKESSNHRARRLLDRFHLPYIEATGLIERSESITQTAENFADFLRRRDFDCIVIDRLCGVAAFAAHLAEIPWATVGTDGREWKFKKLRTRMHHGAFPGSWRNSPMRRIRLSFYRDDFPRPSSRSIWATSPFLNISFFPRAYYPSGPGAALPRHSHFLGYGESPVSGTGNDYLLVTFGNSFFPVLRVAVMERMKPLIEDLGISVLVLTGDSEVSKAVAQEFRHDSQVEVREWVPYDEAYRGAVGVVGHGGTSHVWYGLREGTPLLAIPQRGDQHFGASQINRLGVGLEVIPRTISRLLPSQIRRFGAWIVPPDNVYLNGRDFGDGLARVLSDPAIRDSAGDFSHRMRGGGGVRAGVSLLKRLAETRQPVRECVAPTCCC